MVVTMLFILFYFIGVEWIYNVVFISGVIVIVIQLFIHVHLFFFKFFFPFRLLQNSEQSFLYRVCYTVGP